MANVIDAMLEHHKAGKAKTESEAAPFIRIKAAGSENIGVDEPAGEQLDPGRFFAHAAAIGAERAASVQFETRLDERKKAWTKPHVEIAAENSAKERLHGAN